MQRIRILSFKIRSSTDKERVIGTMDSHYLATLDRVQFTRCLVWSSWRRQQFWRRIGPLFSGRASLRGINYPGKKKDSMVRHHTRKFLVDYSLSLHARQCRLVRHARFHHQGLDKGDR